MSRNSRLLLTVTIASSMLLAGVVAITHSHFSLRSDSGTASIESICPCGAHQFPGSDSDGSNESDSSRCLTCRLIAQLHAQTIASIEFKFDSMVVFVANADVANVATRPCRYFQGRAPPIV